MIGTHHDDLHAGWIREHLTDDLGIDDEHAMIIALDDLLEDLSDELEVDMIEAVEDLIARLSDNN